MMYLEMLREELADQNNLKKQLQTKNQMLVAKVNQMDDVRPLIDEFMALRVIIINAELPQKD
jgi:cell division protein FtsB